MNNFLHAPNLSLRIFDFNDIYISLARTYVRKTKLSNKSKPWMTLHLREKIHTRNCLRWTICQNRQEWINTCHGVLRLSTRSRRKLERSRSRCIVEFRQPKYVEGLNGSRVSMSHEGRSITDIKSKNSKFINKYARVSRLSMSRAHQVNNSRNVSTHHMLSSWSWQHSAFISQVTWSFGPPRITIHIQLILFTCPLRTHLVGCHNHSITKTWKISK